jgi:hypothetical protein
MVRLVFRPYTQIRRTICTSVSLRASTRVSSGFALFRHSSPSFGSRQVCSYSNLSNKYPDRSIVQAPPCGAPSYHGYFHFAYGFSHPNTRIHVRLLGPCFKTGRLEPFRQGIRSVVEDSHAPARPPTRTAIWPPSKGRTGRAARRQPDERGPRGYAA